MTRAWRVLCGFGFLYTITLHTVRPANIECPPPPSPTRQISLLDSPSRAALSVWASGRVAGRCGLHAMCACEGWVGGGGRHAVAAGASAQDAAAAAAAEGAIGVQVSVFRCRCSGVRSVSGRCCQLASAATAWVGELGLTQPAEVTRPSMLLTALGLRPATVGGGGGRWAVGEA